MIPSKYLVVLIQILTIVTTSLLAANADEVLSPVEVVQIAAIGVGSISAYAIPLLKAGPAVLGKFLASVAGAALAAIPPIVDTANGGSGWTSTAVLIVVLAGLNAALTAWGAQVRIEDVKIQLADPDVPDRLVVLADPGAASVHYSHAS